MFLDIDDGIRDLPIFYETIQVNGEEKTTKQFVCNARKWLKSLKERVQPKQEWSGEDEVISEELIKYFESLLDSLATEERHNENRRWLNWLKSIKDRVQPIPKQE